MKKGLLALVAVLLLFAAAFLLARLLPGPAPDEVDQRIQELEERLARSERLRDSLDTVIALKEDSLRIWRARDDSLGVELARLENNITRQQRTIVQLRQNITRYDLPPDSLLRDLNHIYRMVFTSTSPTDR